MSKVAEQEALSALWTIASILSFGFGHESLGYILGVMGVLSFILAVVVMLDIKPKSKDGWKVG